VRDNVQTVTLKYAPIPESVQLRITPFDPDLKYSIEGRSIRFNKTPNKGTKIEVLYMAH
jgi:hypothetical protein